MLADSRPCSALKGQMCRTMCHLATWQDSSRPVCNDLEQGLDPRPSSMSPSPTDYEHGVFFSYKRHSLTLDWTTGVHNRLKFWITQAVGGREVEMFVDEESIETGDRWPEKLKEALKLSRCMV